MIKKKWPLHPQPFQRQPLYRWVEELAQVYHVSYRSFCKNILKLTPEETDNLRKELPEHALKILSEGTGIPITELNKRDIYTLFSIAFNELSEFVSTLSEEEIKQMWSPTHVREDEIIAPIINENGVIVKVDSKGRIYLGEMFYEVSSYKVTLGDNGKIVLEPYVEIPFSQKWVLDRKDILEKVKKQLRENRCFPIEEK